MRIRFNVAADNEMSSLALDEKNSLRPLVIA